MLSISAGIERLNFFIIIFILYMHVTTCMFIFLDQFVDTVSWIDVQTHKAVENGEIKEENNLLQTKQFLVMKEIVETQEENKQLASYNETLKDYNSKLVDQNHLLLQEMEQVKDENCQLQEQI